MLGRIHSEDGGRKYGEADSEDGSVRYAGKGKTKNEMDGYHQANKCDMEEGDAQDRRRWTRMVQIQTPDLDPRL